MPPARICRPPFGAVLGRYAKVHLPGHPFASGARVAVVSAIVLAIAAVTGSNYAERGRAVSSAGVAADSTRDAGPLTVDKALPTAGVRTALVTAERYDVLRAPATASRLSSADRVRSEPTPGAPDAARARSQAGPDSRTREKTLAGLLLMLRQGHGFR